MGIAKENLLDELKQDLQDIDIDSWRNLDKVRNKNGQVIGTDNKYKGFKFYISAEAKDFLDRASRSSGITQSQLMRNLIVEYLISIRDN